MTQVKRHSTTAQLAFNHHDHADATLGAVLRSLGPHIFVSLRHFPLFAISGRTSGRHEGLQGLHL